MLKRRETATHSSLAPQQYSNLESVSRPKAKNTSSRKSRLAQFPPLKDVTRPNLKTEEAAYYLNREPQTLRAWAMRDGSGPIRPRRIGGLLAWNTDEIRALCGVQAGFSTPIYLFSLALLAIFVWATWPGIFGALDWAGFTALGAGVISNRFRPTDSQFDLNDFIEAATYRGDIGGVIVRDSKPICTLQRDGQTIELAAEETAKYVSDYEFMAYQDQLYIGFLYSQHPDEVANAPTITEHFSGKSERRAQANVTTSIHQGRPTMGTLNDVLKDNPTKNETPSGQGKGFQGSTNGQDFTADQKRLANVIGQMALLGHQVHRLEDGFLVTRWGMTKVCPDIASLVGFARQIGASYVK